MKVFGEDFSDRYALAASREWQERMLRELQEHSPRMRERCPTEREWWGWFCGEADSLLRGLSTSERRILARRLNSVLQQTPSKRRYHPPD